LPSPFLADESDGPMVLAKDGAVLLAINGKPDDGSPEKVALLEKLGRFPISGGCIDATQEAGNREASHFSNTWNVLSTIGTDHEMSEPTVAQLPDGRLVLVTRPEGDIAWSSDDGHTWSRPVTFGMRLFAPSLYVLRDGTLVCLHGSYGAGGLRVIFSTDGGQTWIAPAANPGGGFLPSSRRHGFLIDNSYGYGKAMELSDGSLFIVYLRTGGHAATDARSNATQCIRMKIRPDHAGIDLLPAPDRMN
jgi:hypothetical protein